MAIRALDKGDVDPAFMMKLAKIATAEVISTKVSLTPIFYAHQVIFMSYN